MLCSSCKQEIIREEIPYSCSDCGCVFCSFCSVTEIIPEETICFDCLYRQEREDWTNSQPPLIEELNENDAEDE
jgi:hypothetical protein